ncbi:MAG: fibronectin type III domain-containing protein, partial [Patescibacteria group bacterium]
MKIKLTIIAVVLGLTAMGLLSAPGVFALTYEGTIGGGNGGSIGPLSAPASVSAVASGYTSIDISWGAVAGASGYKVYRNAADANWDSATLATTTISSVTSFSDTALTSGTTYYYKVKSYNSSQTSDFSVAASAATNALAVPANLTASVQSTTGINLSWSAVSGVDGYKLYRNDSLIATQTGLIYSDTGLSAGTSYSYKVKSYAGSI